MPLIKAYFSCAHFCSNKVLHPHYPKPHVNIQNFLLVSTDVTNTLRYNRFIFLLIEVPLRSLQLLPETGHAEQVYDPSLLNEHALDKFSFLTLIIVKILKMNFINYSLQLKTSN